jgi:phosphatidylinositol glycan class M
MWGYIPLIPQILILGFSSLGIAPYDLSFALFCQTSAFVAFNKVITAQYFTWYLCLLPLCSDRVHWQSKRMFIALGILFLSIIVWLLSAFTLEMLGWRTHRQVWLASLFFFIANMNLLRSIIMGYNRKSIGASSTQTGDDSAIQKLKKS